MGSWEEAVWRGTTCEDGMKWGDSIRYSVAEERSEEKALGIWDEVSRAA